MGASTLLLLEYDASLVPEGGASVVCKLGAPVPSQSKEAAGWIFHDFALRQRGLLKDPEPEEEQAEAQNGKANGETLSRSSSQAIDDQPPPGVEFKSSKKKKDKKKKGEQKSDYYALLNLQHERWMATENQIKLSYRKTCLEHHPDKKLAGVTDEEEKQRIEDYFKQIQEAYEVLSDPGKRREYDSQDDFDDSLPTDCAAQDFFKVFGPAFRRNARWSVDKNVPDVGDEGSSWEQVTAFYDFWYSFKSWREFPHPDEEDVEAAESREHRRWMERINSKLREKAKKEEGRRLRDFVDAAYRIDPRVARRKEEERQERERKKQEKEDAKRRAAEEEAARKAAEEQVKKEQEAAARKAAEEARKQKEKDKKALKQQRSRLRGICSETDAAGERLLPEDDADTLCAKLDYAALQQLCDGLCAPGLARPTKEQILSQAMDAVLGEAAAAARQKEILKREAEKAAREHARKEHERKVALMREWDDEELRLLDKAMKKWPQGTHKRWEQVTAYVRTRTQEEVLLMVKERQGASAARFKAQEDWKAARKNPAEVQSQPDLRDNAFTDVNISIRAEAAAAAAASAKAAAAAAAEPAGAAAAPAAAAPAAAAPAAAAAAAPKAVVSADSGVWTEEQELALVKALKQVGKDASDRWEQISALVPGKSKAQCFKRFKELKEVFKSKKAG